MSGGGLNDGTFLGVNFSPVNVNVPEPCRKVVRAPIPLGVPSSSGWVISCVGSLDGLCACSYDVFTGLQVLSGYAGYVLLGEELPLEFTHVCVAGVALEKLSRFWGN